MQAPTPLIDVRKLAHSRPIARAGSPTRQQHHGLAPLDSDYALQASMELYKACKAVRGWRMFEHATAYATVNLEVEDKTVPVIGGTILRKSYPEG